MILADTGPLYALLDRDEPRHALVKAFVEAAREPILVPSPILSELCFFVGRRLGAGVEAALLARVGRGELPVVEPVDADYLRAATLVETYADWPLGGSDALLVAIAERLTIRRLLSFDHRHLGALRPEHAPGFELLPEGGGAGR